MAEPYNKYSKSEDADLKNAMYDIVDYCNEYLHLPDGYAYELWDKIPYNRIYEFHISNGIQPCDLTHLLVKNPKGRYAAIEPDGGLIVAVKKDSGGNISNLIPLLSSEAKHQESDVGNAIERVFKNLNAIRDLFNCFDIFPYVCFCQGEGFDNQFILNKLRIGIGGNINEDVNIKDRICEIIEQSPLAKKITKKQFTKKVGSIFARKERWDKEEMYGRLLSAMKQSYNYFFG